MRMKNLILGDIKFQFKYGFYFLYLVLSITYICIINLFSTFMREKIAFITHFMFFFASTMVILGEIDDSISRYLIVSPLGKTGCFFHDLEYQLF
ncbi:MULTISPECIES: hypothetical protein [unclassified Clostridioides]|uniref:hypothetical protein n=1 Tax=unclassified Clostridioides TaxID=2635829 RepID=UPI001D10CBC5